MTYYKLKIYAKMTGIALLLALVLMFIISNQDPVTVKFLGWTIWQTKLYALILAVAGMGIVIFLITRKIRKVIGEYRQLRREDKTRKELVTKVKNEMEQETGSK